MNHTDHTPSAELSIGPSGPRQHGASNKHAGHSVAIFKKRFWIVLGVTIPVLVLSDIIQGLLSYQIPDFVGQEWIVPVLGTFIFFFGGLIFLTSAV
ncbi:MAG: heavy metal translocating P-type ATPase, partial [Parcubacteria group bacterium]